MQVTVYYIFLGVFGVFVLLVFVIGGFAAIQQWRMPMEKRVERVRKLLLDRENDTGLTVYPIGSTSRMSRDMVVEIAESEGFQLVSSSHYRITFQRVLPGAE